MGNSLWKDRDEISTPFTSSLFNWVKGFKTSTLRLSPEWSTLWCKESVTLTGPYYYYYKDYSNYRYSILSNRSKRSAFQTRGLFWVANGSYRVDHRPSLPKPTCEKQTFGTGDRRKEGMSTRTRGPMSSVPSFKTTWVGRMEIPLRRSPLSNPHLPSIHRTKDEPERVWARLTSGHVSVQGTNFV